MIVLRRQKTPHERFRPFELSERASMTSRRLRLGIPASRGSSQQHLDDGVSGSAIPVARPDGDGDGVAGTVDQEARRQGPDRVAVGYFQAGIEANRKGESQLLHERR